MTVSMVFPNLPVADITVAKNFYTGLGFELNPMFSDESTACVVINEQVAVMLLETDRFSSFLSEGVEVVTGHDRKEVMNALLLGNNDEVDAITTKAEANGGTILKPAEANEFGMYGSTFTDPDGHIWEAFYMAAPEA